MKRLFICGLVSFLGFVVPVFAGDLAQGIPDFVSEGILRGTSTCDSGATKFSSYHHVASRGRGMTIAVNGKVRYYIFSPNPDSMSPITWTFAVETSGGLKDISRQERDENLRTEAPNLHAIFFGRKNDCTHEIFPSN